LQRDTAGALRRHVDEPFTMNFESAPCDRPRPVGLPSQTSAAAWLGRRGNRIWLVAGAIMFALGIVLGAAATDRLRADDPVAPGRARPAATAFAGFA
jgi:hypothetical protein